MPKVVFIGLDGAQRVVEVDAGDSVMAAAVRNGVPRHRGRVRRKLQLRHLPRLYRC